MEGAIDRTPPELYVILQYSHSRWVDVQIDHSLRIVNHSESKGVPLSFGFCLFEKDSIGVFEETDISGTSVQIPLALTFHL